MTKEWIPYKINNSKSELRTVSHVAHLSTSQNIILDGKLKNSLVGERSKSKLSDKRILICWLSPNDWGLHGFRYGNIRFSFDWEKLLNRTKNYYWVEAVTEYSPNACRFLLTNKNYHFLEKYNPAKDDGPWKYDSVNAKHYWNDKYCLEFMFEEEINLIDSENLDFVHHNRYLCSNYWKGCENKELWDHYAAEKFLAIVIGKELPKEALKFVIKKNGKINPSGTLKYAFSNLFAGIIEKIESQSNIAVEIVPNYFSTKRINIFTGNIKSNDIVALPLCRSIINNYANENDNDFFKLSSLFKTEIDLLQTLQKLVSEEFEIDFNSLKFNVDKTLEQRDLETKYLDTLFDRDFAL